MSVEGPTQSTNPGSRGHSPRADRTAATLRMTQAERSYTRHGSDNQQPASRDRRKKQIPECRIPPSKTPFSREVKKQPAPTSAHRSAQRAPQRPAYQRPTSAHRSAQPCAAPIPLAPTTSRHSVRGATNARHGINQRVAARPARTLPEQQQYHSLVLIGNLFCQK